MEQEQTRTIHTQRVTITKKGNLGKILGRNDNIGIIRGRNDNLGIISRKGVIICCFILFR